MISVAIFKDGPETSDGLVGVCVCVFHWRAPAATANRDARATGDFAGMAGPLGWGEGD